MDLALPVLRVPRAEPAQQVKKVLPVQQDPLEPQVSLAQQDQRVQPAARVSRVPRDQRGPPVLPVLRVPRVQPVQQAALVLPAPPAQPEPLVLSVPQGQRGVQV